MLIVVGEPLPLNDEQKLQAYVMWNEGQSAGMIGRYFGKTRSAVMGVIKRAPLGMITRLANARPSKLVVNKPIELQKKCAALPVYTPEEEEPTPIGEPEECADGCQFMHGDIRTPGWRYCGHEPHTKGSSWCAYHWFKHVRNPVQPTRKTTNVQQPKFDGRCRNGWGGKRKRSTEIEDNTPDVVSASERDIRPSW